MTGWGVGGLLVLGDEAEAGFASKAGIGRLGSFLRPGGRHVRGGVARQVSMPAATGPHP